MPWPLAPPLECWLPYAAAGSRLHGRRRTSPLPSAPAARSDGTLQCPGPWHHPLNVGCPVAAAGNHLHVTTRSTPLPDAPAARSDGMSCCSRSVAQAQVWRCARERWQVCGDMATCMQMLLLLPCFYCPCQCPCCCRCCSCPCPCPCISTGQVAAQRSLLLHTTQHPSARRSCLHVQLLRGWHRVAEAASPHMPWFLMACTARPVKQEGAYGYARWRGLRVKGSGKAVW